MQKHREQWEAFASRHWDLITGLAGVGLCILFVFILVGSLGAFHPHQ